MMDSWTHCDCIDLHFDLIFAFWEKLRDTLLTNANAAEVDLHFTCHTKVTHKILENNNTFEFQDKIHFLSPHLILGSKRDIYHTKYRIIAVCACAQIKVTTQTGRLLIVKLMSYIVIKLALKNSYITTLPAHGQSGSLVT